MRRGILTLLLAAGLLLTVQHAGAQRFVGTVAGGINVTQIDGDELYGFRKAGVNAGAGVMLHLGPKQAWSLLAELLFAQKGSRKYYKSAGAFDTIYYAPSMFMDVDRSVPFDPLAKGHIKLDYVQIPLLVAYEDMKSGCSFGLGFSWSRLVRAEETYNGFKRTTNVRSDTYNTSDWSILVDAGIRLYKNLTLNVRYEYSMVPIRKVTYEFVKGDAVVETKHDRYQNNVLTFRLQYFINEKYVRNTNYNRKGELIGTKWVRDIPDYD